jgi:hypothetical protein
MQSSLGPSVLHEQIGRILAGFRLDSSLLQRDVVISAHQLDRLARVSVCHPNERQRNQGRSKCVQNHVIDCRITFREL